MYLKNNKLENQLPFCNGVFNNLIRQADNYRANKVVKRVKNLIKMAKIKFIDNSIIIEKHLGRRRWIRMLMET